MKKNVIIIMSLILILSITYLIGAPLLVESLYSSFGFNEHVNYESIRKSWEYGLDSIEIDLITEDGIGIHIYEVNVPEPRGIIIMLSGITGPSVTHFYGQSRLVADIGFASILVETRGHGKSDGDKVTFGVDDVKDVNATVDYINNQDKYQNIPIIIMGLSMGGATAINAGSLNEDIDAIIALSPFSSWTDVASETAAVNGCPKFIANLLKPAVILNGLRRNGPDYLVMQPEQTIKLAGNKPILLMACVGDNQVPISNHFRLIKSYEGDQLETWIRPSNDHFVVKDNHIDDPFQDEAYCEKITSFLNKIVARERNLAYA